MDRVYVFLAAFNIQLYVISLALVDTPDSTCQHFHHKRQNEAEYQERRVQCGKLLGMKIESERNFIIELFDGSHMMRLDNEGLPESGLFYAVDFDSKDSRTFLSRFVGLPSTDFFSKQSANWPATCWNLQHLLDAQGGKAVDLTSKSNEEHFNFYRRKCGRLQQQWNQVVTKKFITDESQFTFLSTAQELFEFDFTASQNRQHSEYGLGDAKLKIRRRRAMSLIFPGTHWCGVGNVSSAEQTYGGKIGVDRCCHEHDRCDYTIEKFSTRYGLFNYRFHTLSHCECDDRFRTCLRALASEEAHRIGTLYFNVIGMRCFVLQRERVCSERNWWGRCIRFTTEVKAVMHDPLEY